MSSSTTTANTTTELGLSLPLEMLRSVGFFRQMGEIEDGDFGGNKVANYVSALEEEKRKIEPFKRELSLCLQLVTDLIDYLKRDLVNATPVLEHFLPIKSTPLDKNTGATENPEKETRDRNKMDWMSSAQLWSDNYSDEAISNNNDNKTNIGFGGPIAMATATPVVHPLYFQLHNRPQTQNHHISLSKPSLRGPTLPRASLSPPPSAEGTPSEASQLSGCMKCGKQDLEKGCNGDGRIQGGIATIPGFGWWPIKAYKPCPGLVELGGTYKRYGQSLDEIVGRSDRSK